MTCHNTGRDPIVTIGLGTSSEYPLSRIPAPPQKSTTFISYPLIHRDFRDRDNELAAPLANELQLLHDFFFQVPRQYYDVARFGFSDPVGMINRNMRARKEPPLFVRTAIDRVFDQVF